MCKKRTEMFLKLASKYKVGRVCDLKDLFIKGFEAVAEDGSESHKELTDKLTDLEKKFENQSKRIDERLNSIDYTLQQIMDSVVKPRGKIFAFFQSKCAVILYVVILAIIMLSGIGFMGLLDKSPNIAEIIQSTKK